uniref:Uncharacterized protein n=1 Tax=Pseudo-nitzschia multistriata TaxID=183589 RepID=A0A448Z5T4_9STRA
MGHKGDTLDEDQIDTTDDESSFSSSSSSSFDIIDNIIGPLDANETFGPDASHLGTATYDDVPGSSIHLCLELLSSKDPDLIRVGLQRLMLLTKGRTLSGLYHSEEVASHVLVFGGPLGTIEELLRYIFATLICDSPHQDHREKHLTTGVTDFDEDKDALFDWILDYDPLTGIDGNGKHISYYDDDHSCTSSDSEDTERQPLHPQGKANGIFHNHALRVLANALGKVASTTTTKSLNDTEQQALRDPLWNNMIRSLIENIETNRNTDATGYSLKILRLLYSVDPETIEPLLKYSLFDRLVFFAEYGKFYRYPMIYTEASELLNRTIQHSEESNV